MTSASDNLAALVDDMLQDAGCAQDAELRGALLSLAALASLPAPAPTGELAALLTTGVPAPAEDDVQAARGEERTVEQRGEQHDEQPDDELARRRRRRHRPTALGLVLVAGMGLGVGGVAASSTPSGSSAVEHLLEEWKPWSAPAGERSAVGRGYRAPKVASEGELAAAGSPAAPGGSIDAANLASRLVRDPDASSRHAGQGHAGAHAGIPACAGPVQHDAATGAGKCTPAAAGGASHGSVSGSGKEDAGAAAEGTPSGAGAGAAGIAKTGQPASNTPPAAADAAGAAPKAAGTAAGAAPAQGQGQFGSQGVGQGNGPKPTSPAK